MMLLNAMGTGLSSLLLPLSIAIVLSATIGCSTKWFCSNASGSFIQASSEITFGTLLEEVSSKSSKIEIAATEVITSRSSV